MRKLIPILMMFVVFFNSLNLNVHAAVNEYDHEILMDYKGYGEAMYEGVVRETTFITGQYTENKEYVSQTIDEIVDYAKFWYNEGNKSCSDYGSSSECLKGLLSMAGGYAMTVGDLIKSFFNDFKEEKSVVEDSAFNQFVYSFSSTANGAEIIFNGDYAMRVTVPVNQSYTFYNSIRTLNNGNGYYSYVELNNGQLRNIASNYYSVDSPSIPARDWSTLRSTLSTLNNWGVTYAFVKVDTPNEPIELPKIVAPEITRINNYIQNMSAEQTITTPKPRPYLSCPDGTKIQMSIDGSTFLKADGTVMVVSKDGTATVDSSICNLGWTVPDVKYVDDQVAIEEPGGEYKDAETGEVIGGGGSGDGSDNTCDSVLCNVAKIFEAIGSFFEKLMDFVIKVFIPEDTTAIKEGFDGLTNVFNDKFAVMTTIKDTFTNSFNENQKSSLEDYYLTLPILDNKPIEMFNFEYIDFAIPIAKKFVGGVTIIFTLWYVYRKITGNGGVMEK